METAAKRLLLQPTLTFMGKKFPTTFICVPVTMGTVYENNLRVFSRYSDYATAGKPTNRGCSAGRMKYFCFPAAFSSTMFFFLKF
jgi:hypothetical protein